MAENLKVLTNKRGQIKAKLTRFKSYLDSIDLSNDMSQLKGRLSKFEECWTDFELVQTQIEIAQDSEAEQSEERATFEDIYFELRTKAESLLTIRNTPTLSPSNQTSYNIDAIQPQVKLPTIKLPTFDGNYEEWLPFHEMFISLIHDNQTLTDIQRFHYLKTSLQGPAKNVIESLEVSPANYKIALDLLKNRFDNKRIIVYKHVIAIHNIEKIDRESGSALRNMLDSLNNHLRALKTLGEPVEHWGTLLIYTVTQKLDFNTFRQWENQLISTNVPTFAGLLKFLELRCQSLESINNNKNDSKINIKLPFCSNPKPQLNRKPHNTALVANITKCPLCSENHKIFYCEVFKNMPILTRIQKVRTMGLCLNCLSKNHQVKDCQSSKCKKCNKKHNTLLHLTSHVQTPSNISKEPQVESSHTVRPTLTSETKNNQILLSTAIVDVEDVYGARQACRVLLDSASQSNFITEAMVQKLQIEKVKSNTQITGIGQNHTNIVHSVNCTIHSRYNSYQVSLNCLILPKITCDLPGVYLDTSNWNIPRNIHLADVDFNISRPIDMLIGAEMFFNLMSMGQIRPHKEAPIFQKTSLGWIASGKVSNDISQEETICHLSTNDRLPSQLHKFWEIEECKPERMQLTGDELLCENYYLATTTRDNTGRYTVKMPLKDNVNQLGNSQITAEKRFLQLERKLANNHSLKTSYTDFMEEYERVGHMEAITIKDDEEAGISYYIPHLSVVREDSTTTKVRVVFDASAKSSSGLSLNDTLMVGPTIQQDIFAILSRFRCHQYALTADIEKMYRQILIDQQQTDLQRILWRKKSTDILKAYKLKTITYGTASAPFLAVRTLQQLAKDERDKFPLASTITLRDFYVDDLMTGCNTLEGAKVIQTQITELLKAGGFNIRKWNSNSCEILKTIKIENRAQIHENNKVGSTKVLGMSWNASSDSFNYLIKEINPFAKISKRSVLSEIASLFDPLGLLGPVVLKSKLFMQELWRLNLKWDETLPVTLFTSWQIYRQQLALLKEIQIPRHVVRSQALKTELHGFCDASERAYGACFYLRTMTADGKISSNLLCSKSRVSPLKKITIPRLELCGALLLSKLLDKVISSNITFDSCTLWSDSTIVLTWIHASSTNWKTFVSNRVNEIQKLTIDKCNWKHVRTASNPADLISRGLNPVQILNYNFWWHGPVWLTIPSDEWPETEPISVKDIPEQRRSQINLASTAHQSLIEVSRYSSLPKLQRITAYCLRFIKNMNSPVNKLTGPLLPHELTNALNYLIKANQQIYLQDDYKHIKKGKEVKTTSSLYMLHPFIDSEGLLRVGGRLRNAKINIHQKHPVILPTKSHLTELIIRQEHMRNLHAGPQLLLATVRQRYWPLKGRDLTRKIVHSCVRCFRASPKVRHPLMGDLPSVRLQPSRPFTNTGTDLCGPVFIRTSRRRNSQKTKGYIVLFVCLSTKAIHLELVTDLTTEAFLAALKRFISRRGICSKMYSDNGTNFVGADRELKEIRDMFASEQHQRKVIDTTSCQQIEWHFIPPRSPHFGGIWEAGVKSMKYHLKRVVGNASLTYEEFYTTLTQIEACLNSRPLTPLSNDADDILPLTPGHFLTGDALTSIPCPNMSDIPDNRLSHWQRTQQLTQHFWARWSKEYLTLLQQRPKWKTDSINIKPGDLVVIKEDNLPPLRWVTARVLEVHPGADNRVRVVTVKTSSGIFKRATNRLCPLPLDPIKQ